LVKDRYPNLYEQNKTRANAQWNFYNDFVNNKKAVYKIVRQNV